MAKPTNPKPSNDQKKQLIESDPLEAEIDRRIGDVVSQKQREVIVSRMASFMIQEQFSGPIPHPRHFEKYDAILPGAGDRILSMAEKQQAHMIDMDQRVLDAEKSDRRTGMVLGWLGLLALVACAFLSALLTESEVIPGLFLTTAAIGAISTFVNGRKS